jgi:hypothetical protein
MLAKGEGDSFDNLTLSSLTMTASAGWAMRTKASRYFGLTNQAP